MLFIYIFTCLWALFCFSNQVLLTKIYLIQFDISDFASIDEKASEAIQKLNGIDVLINNAGIGQRASLEDITLDFMQEIFSTNVFGLTILTQLVVKEFKKIGKGNIINIFTPHYLYL